MHEPAVTLTDYLVAAECLLFMCLVGRSARMTPLAAPFGLFFGSAAVAAAAGGTVHGFCPGDTVAHRMIWLVALWAVGATALSAWVIGGRLRFSKRVARGIMLVAVAEYVIYCLTILFLSANFRVAVLNYLPAVLFLLAVLALAYVRTRQLPLLAGVLGFLLTLIGAALQQAKLSVHPMYLDHNTLYHVVQAAAFALIFCCARWLIVGGPRFVVPEGSGGDPC